MATILVWLGSGFAFAVGVFFGAWCMRKAGGNADAIDASKQATEALVERNRIGFEEVVALRRIAEAIESIRMK